MKKYKVRRNLDIVKERLLQERLGFLVQSWESCKVRESKMERNFWERKENDMKSKKQRTGQMKFHAAFNQHIELVGIRYHGSGELKRAEKDQAFVWIMKESKLH